MTASQTYEVEYLDGSSIEVDVAFTPGAMLRAERELNKPIGVLAASGFSEPEFFVTWWTLQKSGKTPLKYEEWVDSLAALRPVGLTPTDDVEEEVDAGNPPKSSSPTESGEQPQP